MKKLTTALFASLLTFGLCAQTTTENTLLWRISGKGLEKPSYLYGTIHMICKDDAQLSDSLKKVISRADAIYLEIDMDNIVEMMGMLPKMKMRGDTTLKDLLSVKDYNQVKSYFDANATIIPFTMLETFKPILATSLLQEKSFGCEETAAMEQVIMEEGKKYKKKIDGLETASYQADVLDEIPYQLQADMLLGYVKEGNKASSDTSEMMQLMDAYKTQDIGKLEQLMLKSDLGMDQYQEVLLFRRNRNWVEKMKKIMPGKTFLFAVGAGHLPGDQGVIKLLRKAGYKVEPVDNRWMKEL